MDDDAGVSELSCPLCKGYLIDAVTMTRCSHSFCRGCLLLKLEANKKCPLSNCDNKFENLSEAFCRDTTLQSFVFKFMPASFLKEIKQRSDFITRRLPSEEERRMIVKWNVTDFGQYLSLKDEMISLSIEYVTREDILLHAKRQAQATIDDDGQPIIIPPRKKSEFIRYFRCPAAVKIKHFKTLLEGKLELPDNYVLYFIELDSEEIIEESYSIQDLIYIFGWSRLKPFQLFFTFAPLISDEEKPPVLEVEEVLDQVKDDEMEPPQLESECDAKMPAFPFTVNLSTSLFAKETHGTSPNGFLPRMPIITATTEAPPKKKRRLGPRKERVPKKISTPSAASSNPSSAPDLTSKASPSAAKASSSPSKSSPANGVTSPSRGTEATVFRFTPPESSSTTPNGCGKASSSPTVLTVEQSNTQLNQVFAPISSAPPTPIDDHEHSTQIFTATKPDNHASSYSLSMRQQIMEAMANGSIKLPPNTEYLMLQNRPNYISMLP